MVHDLQEAKDAAAAAVKAQEEEQQQKAAEAARQQEELAQNQRAMEEQKAKDLAQLEARLVSLHSKLTCCVTCTFGAWAVKRMLCKHHWVISTMQLSSAQHVSGTA